jgi:hypothetical protein
VAACVQWFIRYDSVCLMREACLILKEMTNKALCSIPVTPLSRWLNRLRTALAIMTVFCVWFGGRQAKAAEGESTKSALEAEPEGWRNIMPGADLKGWYRVPVPPTGKLGREQWHVDAAAKVLVCDGDGGHDMLLMDEEIGDAIFHFEFRYTQVEGKTGYNSGAYVRNSKDGALWHQAQFGDAKDGFLFGQTLTEDGKKQSFHLAKAVKDMRVKPAGEWNTFEVTARGKKLTLWVNGAVTCEFTDCGVPQGRVGLEGECYRIEFRNLKLKKLN